MIRRVLAWGGIWMALVIGLGVVAGGTAHAQTSKQQCISSYTDAQRDRRDGKLLQARSELRVCASDPCPAALQRDCSQWLGEVERVVPSVVFGARDPSGRDLFEAAIAIDGRALVSRLDGRPVEVDPGEHHLRFEAPGYEPVEERVLFREGEKGRSLSVTLKPNTASGSESNAADVSVSEPARTYTGGQTTRPVPATTWIFGGVAVAAFATAATTALVGLPTWSRCHDGGCTASDQRRSDTLNTAGDVATIVGGVSAVAALYFFLTRPSFAIEPRVTSHAATVDVRATF